MTELGFGLVDRRSVVVVLMTLILCQVLLGFSIPLDTTTVLSLLVSLIFFTTYMYTARTILRLPFILWPSSKVIVRFYRSYREARSERWLTGYSSREAKRDLDLAITGQQLWDGHWGILDRGLLIGIVVMATIPTVGQTLIEIIGTAGLFLMLVIYLIRGHFGFAVEDALKRGTEEQERLAHLSRADIPSFPRVIETKPYSSYDR